MDQWAAIRTAALAAPLTAEPRQRRRWRLLRRFAWPLAAGFLLLLNGWQFSRRQPHLSNTASLGSAPRDSVSSAAPAGSTASSGHAPVDPAGDPPVIVRILQNRLQTELARTEKLSTDYAALQRSRDALNADYDSLLDRLAELGAESRPARLNVMELHGSKSYSAGALALGSTQGKDPSKNPPGTPASGMSIKVVSPVTSGLGSFSLSNSGLLDTTSSPWPLGTSAVISSSSATSFGSPASPYAVAAMGETGHDGMLSLYNLPAITPQEALALWIKTPDSDTLHLVGNLPAGLAGSSGSIYFTVDSNLPTPTDILITREPRPSPNGQPTGPVVVRGPYTPQFDSLGATLPVN